MKRILTTLLLAFTLAGCAASAFRAAKVNANLVKNGMTVREAIALIGTAPTDQTKTILQWRRGYAKTYDGTVSGAIEFKVEDGKVVAIPEGGIFGPVAAARAAAVREARHAVMRSEGEERDRQTAAKLAQEKREESMAMADSLIICSDKIHCGKVFALAQIYVARNSDQKIQVATDTIIETYNPTGSGNVGISVTKAPRAGSTEVVSIIPSCRHDSDGMEALCRLKRTRIYAGFRPFIESSLAP